MAQHLVKNLGRWKVLHLVNLMGYHWVTEMDFHLEQNLLREYLMGNYWGRDFHLVIHLDFLMEIY